MLENQILSHKSFLTGNKFLRLEHFIDIAVLLNLSSEHLVANYFNCIPLPLFWDLILDPLVCITRILQLSYKQMSKGKLSVGCHLYAAILFYLFAFFCRKLKVSFSFNWMAISFNFLNSHNIAILERKRKITNKRNQSLWV